MRCLVLTSSADAEGACHIDKDIPGQQEMVPQLNTDARHSLDLLTASADDEVHVLSIEVTGQKYTRKHAGKSD